MSQRKDLTDSALSDFAELVREYGFQEPVVSQKRSVTRIDYLKGDIAIELELDWREFDVFILVVRLEHGQLPEGYYVSGGRKCRKHLASILIEQGWGKRPVPLGKQRQRTEADFKRSMTHSKEMLLGRLSDLIDAGANLFA